MIRTKKQPKIEKKPEVPEPEAEFDWVDVYMNDTDVYIGDDGKPYYHEDWVIQGVTSDEDSEDTRL